MLLSPGIGQVSGITGKDEYLLSLRTPLTMVEQDKWLVPWLDGAPRLKKPPMLYWLAGASYQLFGPSLVSARLLGVMFATLLILITVLIAWELSAGRRYGLFASLVALSTLAIAVKGRRLMLDVPCAAFSALAFYFFLRWQKRPSLSTMALSALFLSAGFLTKGPLVFMLFGSGVLALLITQAGFRRQLWLYKLHVAGFFALFLMLTAPWFIYVHLAYPEYANAMLAEDIGGRPLLMLGVLLVVMSVQFLTTGVLSELISRTYFESSANRPYVVLNTAEFDAISDKAWKAPPISQKTA